MSKRNFRYVLSLERKMDDGFDQWEEVDTFYGRKEGAEAWFRKVLYKFRKDTPEASNLRVKFCGYVYDR